MKLASGALAAALLVSCAGNSRFDSGETRLYRFVAASADVTRDDSRTWGANWHDFDTDGDADLFAGRHWRPPHFFANRSSKLERSHVGVFAGRDIFGEAVDRHNCAWGEANQDGRPDLYCVQGANKGGGVGPNQMFVQTEEGFDERSRSLNAVDPYGRGRTVNWIDLDADGDLDLFIGNHKRPGYPNRTFLNENGTFRDVRVGLTHELATVGSSWADWDNDKDPDLLVHQLEPKPTVAYENVDGAFVRIEIPGVTDAHWNAGAWGDYNGDGHTDLHLVSRTHSLVLRNDGAVFSPQHRMRLNEGRMSVWLDAENDGDLDLYVLQGARSNGYQPAPGALDRGDFLMIRTRGGFVAPIRNSLRGPGEGNGDAVVASDYDRDGDVDLFITNGYFHSRGRHELLRNSSQTGNWIGLDLIGPSENPQAFGARVLIDTASRDFWRELTDGVNFRGQSEVGYLHAGIAANRTADVMILWPDGTRDCLRVQANEVRTVRIGDSRCVKG